jgi:hypothetical protein
MVTLEGLTISTHKSGGGFDHFFADQVQTIFRKINQVGPANIVLAEDRIHVSEQLAQIVFPEVLHKYKCQFPIQKRMSQVRAWTHNYLSINQFQANAGWVFPQLQELPGCHFDGPDGHTRLASLL